MTALKPLENRRVRSVASERYPLNIACSHPACNEEAADPHHSFPRSAIGGDSWFVEIRHMSNGDDIVWTIPHVTGLCRAHHDDVENHAAWIKLEEGEWRWYDGRQAEKLVDVERGIKEWLLVGPLNPQPGSVEGKPKRKKFQGEKRRTRTTVSIKVPKDAQEDGGAIWDERLEQVREKMTRLGLDPDRPPYYLLTDVMYDWSTSE